MATPATAPCSRVRVARWTTGPQKALIATWAANPAGRLGRWRRPGTSVPAARAAARTSSPRSSAHAVEGAPENTAAATIGRSRTVIRPR